MNFREKVAKNVDLVHFSIGHFIYSGIIECGLSPLFHWCLHILMMFLYFSLINRMLNYVTFICLCL